MLKVVFLLVVVIAGVATDRWVGVRKSVLVDIRRLHAPAGHCASAPLLSLVTCTKLLPNFALHRLFPILHCQTSSPSTNHQPSTIHHRPPCHTMASSPLNIRAPFLAPLSVATAAKVLLELPSLLSTRPRLRRREGSGVPPSYQQPGQWSSHMPPTSFSPPQTTPYAPPSFMPAVHSQAPAQMPSAATYSHIISAPPNIVRPPPSLQPAPGLPARPSFDPPSFNREDMQRMHTGQAPPPARVFTMALH